MGIKTIRQRGAIVGYQAIVGNGGPGQSAYFSVAACGSQMAAHAAAKAKEAEMQSTRPFRVRSAARENAKGIPGLKLRLVQHGEETTPVQYAIATWRHKGRNVERKASAEKHGLLGAVELMLKAREKGIGRALGLTPRQALAAMRRVQHG